MMGMEVSWVWEILGKGVNMFKIHWIKWSKNYIYNLYMCVYIYICQYFIKNICFMVTQ